MVEKSFPTRLQKEALEVEQVLGNAICDTNVSEWILSNGERVEIPYRLDIAANANDRSEKLNDIQIGILSCVLTRCYSGFVRQKHIEYLLNKDLQEWMLPFIIKLSDEYIESIVRVIYGKLRECDDMMIKQFCFNNAKNVITGYARMTSYWNAYYRNVCPDIAEYVGYKLYRECLHIDELSKLCE